MGGEGGWDKLRIESRLRGRKNRNVRRKNPNRKIQKDSGNDERGEDFKTEKGWKKIRKNRMSERRK